MNVREITRTLKQVINRCRPVTFSKQTELLRRKCQVKDYQGRLLSLFTFKNLKKAPTRNVDRVYIYGTATTVRAVK